MGCDIHIYTETKGRDEDDKWVNADCWKYNSYHDKYNDEPEYQIKAIYNNRNYALFSLLAGVRNYGGTTPIAEPRGIPENIHSLTKKEYDMWGLDAHTPSWFTLAELKQAKQTHGIVKYSGMVSPDGAAAIARGEMPNEWCQETNIPGWEYREWEHEHSYFNPIIEKLETIKKDVFWLFRDEEYPEYDEKVRIVFWFDN